MSDAESGTSARDGSPPDAGAGESPQLASLAMVRGALSRPVAMVVLLVAGLVLGVIALQRMPLELIPSGFSAPFLSVSVTYPDATARDVEEKIARPLEEAVATTPGIDQIFTRSTAGSARISMSFAADVDMGLAYRQVRDRVHRVKPELPTDVREIRIRKESGDSLPVAFYALTWDPDLSDPMTVLDQGLVRPVERIDGVGLVNLWGREDPIVQIDVDRGRAEAAGVDMVDLVSTLARANFTLASGTLREGQSQLLLRSVAQLHSPAAIGALMIRSDGLRLSDIAQVTFGPPEQTRYDRYNGKPSLIMAVVKESQANTVELCDRIEAAVTAAKQDPAMAGVQVESVFIQGELIRQSLDQVTDSGLLGGAMALAVLLFFLRRVRLTGVIAVSIPLSLFLALPVMYFTGQSINLVSLIGLMICVGLVVDNSVVVAENIARYRRRGLAPYAAAVQGASEVALAITLATTTTIIVFLPAALLSEGPTQFLMVRMVTPVCVSLVVSLGVALVLVPLASVRLLRDDGPEHRHDDTQPGSNDVVSPWRSKLRALDRAWKRILGALYEHTMGRANRAYASLLTRVLAHRMDVIATSLLALASTALPFSQVQCASGQQFGSRRITVHYSMPSDTTLEEANAFFTGVEALLDAEGPSYGSNRYYVGFDENTGQVQMFFEPPKPGDPPFEATAAALAERLPNKPGWSKTTQLARSDGARDDSLQVALYGDDQDLLAEARDQLQAELLRLDGVVGLRSGDEDTRRRDELSLALDRSMSERYGVSAQALANTVTWGIRGATLPRFHTAKREVDVLLRFRPEDRKDVDDLMTWTLPSPSAGAVSIEVLADKAVTRGEATLQRVNKRAGTVIPLELAGQDRPATLDRVAKFLRGYRLPEGVSFEADGESQAVNDMARDLFGALGLGAIFIFLVMGFLFESFILPMAVLPAIPLSFVGVWWFLYATGENIDSMAGIGIVLLLGVVVNNAIVLIDFVNMARSQGLGREQAVIQAGRLRFRPIMMTSLTTIGGLIPLAFTEPTGEGIAYRGFALALLGGMGTATLLTLVVVPVTYCYLDDLRVALGQWWRRLVGVVRRG